MSSTNSKNQKGQESDPPSEGCRKCGRDDDHSYLLLCESCNDEYHTYCLSPPISHVPEGDFYCPKCQKSQQHLKSFCRDDTLDEQVAALPPPFTRRFGEIIWAAGGNGFGWWPACIYDPRLTVGGARKLALKNIGKKHLVYFFGCTDAPFTVLTDNKCMNWDAGLMDEMDTGKTAKQMGKTRALMFEWALQAAIAENDKPIEYRLDWNHEEDPFVSKNGGGSSNKNGGNANASTKPASTSAKSGTRANNGAEYIGKENTSTSGSRASSSSSSSSKKKVESTRGGTKRSVATPSPIEMDSPSPSPSPTNSNTSATRKKARKEDVAQTPKSPKSNTKATSRNRNSSPNTVPSLIPARRSTRDRKPSRSLVSPNNTAAKRGTKVLPTSSEPAINSKSRIVEKDAPQSSPKPDTAKTKRGRTRKIQFFCTILRNDNVTMTATSISDGEDFINCVKGCGLTRNIGFITIPDRSCTFADAREIMIRDLDVELPSESSADCLPSNFKFFVPHLGPMSRKQESKFGPLFDFLGEDGDMDEDERKRVAEQFGDGSKRNPLKVIVYKWK